MIKYVGIILVIFLLFCGFLGTFENDDDVIKELLSGVNLVSASQQSDETLVEVLENNCRLELIHLKQIYKDFGFSVSEAPRSTAGKRIRDQALPKDNVQKALSILDPLIKESLYKCLSDNSVVSLVSGEDVGSVDRLHKHLENILHGSYPAAKSRRQLAEAPSQAPSPAPKPARASSPSPSSPSRPKRKAPTPPDTFVIPIPVPRASPSLDKDAADGGSDAAGNHHSNSQTTVIVAVVCTAVVTFLVATILFLCCRKAFGGGSGLDHKDDRPLLRLSMSEYSVSDSSSKTWGLENPDGKEKINNQMYYSNSTNAIGVESSNGKPSVEGLRVGSANASSTALKPPPGRNSAPSLGFSPLKPPPGRTEAMPPEPPESMMPASGMGGPPPPPPPKPPAAPPPPPPKKAGPPPPPPGKKPGPPPPPKGGATAPRPPPVAVKAGSTSADDNAAKTKLKPFFWDKVMANPDHSMVWDQIKSGSFQFNEEMIESLFGYAAAENKNEKKKDSSSSDPAAPQFIQLIDQKKAQNLSILLRALNVTTEEVRDALQEGTELPSELLETLLKMAPTADEELRLRLFTGEISQLGPAERFLKVMVDIPFAFKRIEVLLFMGTLQEESTIVKDNFATLEAACKELRNSRLFLKLLEAVLKTGNRMNDGTYRGGAQAFKLDTLLKLADVKGTDGKTTLLHFVVQEIIRSEGLRAARASRESKSMSSVKSEDLLEEVTEESEEHYRSLGLQVVSGVGDQLQNVKKAACLDSDSVTGTIAKLGSGLLKAKNFLNKELDDLNEVNGFHKALRSFVENAEADVMHLIEEEKRIMGLVKSTVDYFHGNSGKEEGLRLFVVVRDFLIMLEKVCREVKARPKWPSRPQKREPPTRQTSTETPRTPFSPDFRNRLFPAIAERRIDGSSSDED